MRWSTVVEGRGLMRSRVRLLAVLLAGTGVLAACSTPPYTRADAERDLAEQTSLTEAQRSCLLDRIEEHFADEYRSIQKANGVDKVSEQQLEVYVKNALAKDADPTPAEERMFDEARAACT